MRILIVAPVDTEIGGVASVVGNLARWLQSRGHEVIFFHSGKSVFAKSKKTKAGFEAFQVNLQIPFGERHPIISLIIFLIRFPIAMCALIRIIRRKKIQVVNIHYPYDNDFYFALCRRILPIRLVTSVHGADLFPNGRPRGKYSLAIRKLLSSSDHIVAPSQRFQQDVISRFPSLREKITFVHNGVDFAGLQKSCAPNSIAGVKHPYLLCIAMHNEKKGLDVLLQAFALMSAEYMQLQLILAGDGPLRERLENQASSLGIQKRVEFLGLMGRVEIAELIRGCEVFVLPSRSEPFGIVLTEAMAFRKPIVATNVGGIPEIIKNGTDGILVEPDNPKALAEALVKVLQNDTYRLSLANNGYMTALNRFSAEKTGASYEALFAALTGSVKQQCTFAPIMFH